MDNVKKIQYSRFLPNLFEFQDGCKKCSLDLSLKRFKAKNPRFSHDLGGKVALEHGTLVPFLLVRRY
jgi:hypothetical protein